MPAAGCRSSNSHRRDLEANFEIVSKVTQTKAPGHELPDAVSASSAITSLASQVDAGSVDMATQDGAACQV
jgi:hypothetical protein